MTRSSLLLVDGHFVCLCEGGTLLLLKVNPKKYEEISHVELKPVDKDGKVDALAEPLLEEPCWAAPVLSHGLLYVRGKDRLACLELIPSRTSPKRYARGPGRLRLSVREACCSAKPQAAGAPR